MIHESDFLLVVQTAFSDDVERWVEKVDILCEELEGNIKAGKFVAGKQAPRIMLTGAPLIWPNYKILNIIEELGAVVVTDDSCAGVQYLYNPVENEEGTKEDMLQGVAEKSMLPCICPCFTHSDDRIDRILEFQEKFSAEGIIYHQLRLCQVFDMEFLPIEKILNQKSIPVLKVETEYSEEDLGQIKTRIEAFLEILRSRRMGL